MRRLLVTLAALFGLLFSGLGGAAASAASNQSLSIAPFLQNVVINETDSAKTFPLTITNKSVQSQKIHLSAINFGTLDEYGGLIFAGSNASGLVKKYGLADWLSLDKPDIELAAGQTAKITATILNSNNLAPGGHYGAIIASVNAPKRGTNNQINVNQQLSALIFAIKNGGVRYDLHLDSISHNANFLRLPSQVTLRFYNPGNVHVTPRGLVKLIHGSTVVSQGVINEASSYVLPETYRRISVELNRINPQPWTPVANYKLEVDYRYDGVDRYAAKTVRFCCLNGKLLLAALAILIIAAAGLRLWLNWRSWDKKHN